MSLTACSVCPGVCSRDARIEAGGCASPALGLTLPEALGHAAKLAACLAHAGAPADPREGAQRAEAGAAVPGLAAGDALGDLLSALMAAAKRDDARATAAALQPFLPRLLPALCASTSCGCSGPPITERVCTVIARVCPEQPSQRLVELPTADAGHFLRLLRQHAALQPTTMPCG